MASPLLSKANTKMVAAQMKAAVTKTGETQTVYLRYSTTPVTDGIGRVITPGTTHTLGPYKARVTEIVAADPYTLHGIAGTLGTQAPDLWLVGKSVIEFVDDLDLESKTDSEFLVVVDGKYLVYKPFKRDDILTTHRDIMGDSLVTYYVVAEYIKEEDIP